MTEDTQSPGSEGSRRRSPIRRRVTDKQKTIRRWKQLHAMGRASLGGRLRSRVLQADRHNRREVKQAEDFVARVSREELLRMCRIVEKADHAVAPSCLRVLLAVPPGDRLNFLAEACCRGWDVRQIGAEKKGRFGVLALSGRPRTKINDEGTARRRLAGYLRDAQRDFDHCRHGGGPALLLPPEEDAIVRRLLRIVAAAEVCFSTPRLDQPAVHADAAWANEPGERARSRRSMSGRGRCHAIN